MAGRELSWHPRRRMVWMSRLVMRLLVLATSLLLALPPGWCATLPSHRTAPPPPKASCCCSCKPTASSEHPNPKPTPPPPVKTCCRADLTVPPTLQFDVRDLAVCPMFTAADNAVDGLGIARTDGV